MGAAWPPTAPAAASRAIRARPAPPREVYIGKLGTKRIVLWDTLLEAMEPDEIDSVMAGKAFVTALPKLLEDGSLWPVFPFPDPFGMDVPWSTTELPLASLTNVRVQEA